MSFIMEIFDEEFHFLLEMIILRRNDLGATLYEIRDDFYNYLSIQLEPIWGYKCWEQIIKPLLENIMQNINKTVDANGCILYYMNVDVAIEKLSCNLTENMVLVREQLGIDLRKLIEIRNASLKSQSRSDSSQSDSIKNAQPKSTSSLISTASQDCEFYGHSLIGDDFFLEVAGIDLKFQKYTKNNIERIGQCISGQTLKKAAKTVKRFVNEIHSDRVIINLGSLDLLQGRELIDMMKDMSQLCNVLCDENIFAIVTTIPPLANQMHNVRLEQKRKSFNTFLLDKFDCIDIEKCMLSVYSRIFFDLYQPEAKTGSGTRCPFVLWNHVGRQRIVKMLKRKIPVIYDELC